MPTSLLGSVRRQPWLVLILQQTTVFALVIAFMKGVVPLIDPQLRSGRTPLGPTALIATVVAYGLMVLVSRGLYRWSQGADAPSLGLAPSRGALGQHLVGLLLGFALTSWSLWLGLATGTMRVTDSIARHFPAGALVLVVLMAFVSLTLNSLNEEVCSRAVPLGLVRRAPLWARVLLPALVFSLLHVAVEPFRLEAFLERTLSGMVFSVAYLLTRDIWFVAGLHTGLNAGVLLGTGRWYMGGLLVVEGESGASAWAHPAVLALLSLAGLWFLYRREAPLAPAMPAPPSPVRELAPVRGA